MDDGLLRELIDLQKEENQLLKKYLWRLRFSLLSLLLLTTATAVGLGFLVYEQKTKVTKVTQPAPTTPTGVYSVWSAPTPTLPSNGDLFEVQPSSGTLQLGTD
jgi:hypothetical protein